MSQEDTLSRKDKKALRDAERQKKGKKRKHSETEEREPDALPAQDGDEDTLEHVAKPRAVKEKRSKKRKSTSNEEKEATPVSAPVPAEDATAAEPKKKRRRGKGNSEGEKPGKNRFIVFIGNLPYKTTDSSLDKHFAKLKPFTLRHRTDPETKKSKGFAFLEFENYDRMKTCLKLYHHSLFDPEAIDRGEAPVEPGAQKESLPAQDAAFKGRHQKMKETARKINVELTAGGGGKTEERKEKIKVKNAKLDEERKRRAEEERKGKEKQAEKDAKAGLRNKKTADKTKGEKKTVVKELQEKAAKGNAKPETSAGAEDRQGMHPSRMRMLSR